MDFINVTIVREATASTVATSVAPWEIPVLEAVHGAVHVRVGESFRVAGREYPTDVDEEWTRLANLYGEGERGNADTAFVTLAFGRGRGGVDALRKAIADARDMAEDDETSAEDRGVVEVAEGEPAVEAKRRGRPPKSTAAVDPLIA